MSKFRAKGFKKHTRCSTTLLDEQSGTSPTSLIENNSAKRYLATFLNVASSSVMISWEVRGQFRNMYAQLVGRETRSRSYSDLLIQFTPMQDANVCFLVVKEPGNFKFEPGKLRAVMNTTQVPFIVNERIRFKKREFGI